MVSTAVACSDTPSTSSDAGATPIPTNTSTTPAPLYGAPPPVDAGRDDGSVAPLYGAPADAGFPDASDSGATDSGRDGSPAPLYGLPPPQ